MDWLQLSGLLNKLIICELESKDYVGNSKKMSKTVASSKNWGSLGFQSDDLLIGLTWQVLVEGYLT